MHDGLDPTTIIFALLAIFVVWKLKSVLGARVDIEKRPPAAPKSPNSSDSGNILRLPGAGERVGPAVRAGSERRLEEFAHSDKGKSGLSAVMDADPAFDPGHFIAGAKTAYEMIIQAFADGDRKTLGGLLSPEVFANFAAVIDQREAAGEIASTKLVSIESAEVVEAGVKGGVAQVSLRVAAKMISATRDKSGAVVSGDPETVVAADDVWTFARLIGSRDPTWRLIATEAAH